MALTNPIPIKHNDPTGAATHQRQRAPFSLMSDFERRGVTHLFHLEPGPPLVTDGADEIVPRDRCSSIQRSDAALVLDLNLRRLAQAPAVLDLMLGERLALLKEGSLLLRLGYVRLSDFCREELGISSRLASELMQVRRELERYPVLKNAFLSGEVNRSALRHILPVITTVTECEWVGKAKRLTVREIEEEAQKVKSHAPGTGGEAGLPAVGSPASPAESEETPGETITVQASSALAWKWDTARELFHRLEGADCPASAFVEGILAEYLSGAPPAAMGNDTASLLLEDNTPLHVQAPGIPIVQPAPLQPLLHNGLSQEEREKLRVQWQEVHQSLEELSNRWDFLSHDPVHVKVKVAGAQEAHGRELVRQCREITALGQKVQFYLARLLRTVNQLSLYRDMMFSSLGHYTVERLGISRRTAYELVWLGRRCIELPELGDAFLSGRLTREQVLLAAAIADEKTVSTWIPWAQRVPVLALRAEVKRIRRLIESDENLPWKALLVPGFAGGGGPGATGSPGEDAEEAGAAQESCLHEGVRVCAAGQEGSGRAGAPAGAPIRLSFSLPHDMKPLWDEALSRFLAAHGSTISAFEGAVDGTMSCNRQNAAYQEIVPPFLEMLLDHFLITWLTLTKKERHHRVLVRDGFRCTIPGCSSRRNLHVHHVVFRSHGGSDEDRNLTTLCLAHHVKGVHEGHITIVGTAPDRLTIQLGVERGEKPFAVWHRGERITAPAVPDA